MGYAIVTALGTQRYSETIYELGGRACPTPYSTVALCHLLEPGPERVVALLTPEAKRETWPKLHAALQSTAVTTQTLDIPAAEDLASLTDLTQRVIERFRGGGEVVLDVTTGFRSLPFAYFSALTFLTSQPGFTLRGVYYGAFNPAARERTPLVDLTPLAQFSNWYYAARRLVQEGDVRPLEVLLRQEKRAAFEAGRGREYAPLLNTLNRLHELAEPLALGLPLELGMAAGRLALAIDLSDPAWQRSALASCALEPIAQVCARLGLAGQKKEALQLSRAEIERELRMARWCLCSGRPNTAVLLLREVMVNRVLLARETGNWLEVGVRRTAEHALGAVARRLRLPGLADTDHEAIGRLWNTVTDLRNRWAHLGFRPQRVDHKREEVASLLEQVKQLTANHDVDWALRRTTTVGLLLVTPLGLSPGMLHTVLRCRQFDRVIAITSRAAQAGLGEALGRATFTPEKCQPYLVDDPHAGFLEADRLVDEIRPHLLQAEHVTCNLTGGTTVLQYIVERVAQEACSLGVPVRRMAVVDRRTIEQQRAEPWVVGECLDLDPPSDAREVTDGA